MNAYELADDLWDKDTQASQQSLQDWAEQAVNMLRQQADRIAELEKQSEPEKFWSNTPSFSDQFKQCEPVGRFYWESVVEGHVVALPSEGTPHYQKDDFPLYTTPHHASDVKQTKPLSDEEIQQISDDHIDWIYETGDIEFARAILRKAQEK